MLSTKATSYHLGKGVVTIWGYYLLSSGQAGYHFGLDVIMRERGCYRLEVKMLSSRMGVLSSMQDGDNMQWV